MGYRSGVLTAVCAFFLFSITVPASGPALSKADEMCMGCHGQTQSMTMGNGKKISLKVNATHLQQSVHGIIGCSDCHGFTADKHPSRSFKTKRQYRAFAARMCTNCHDPNKSKVHASVTGRAAPGTVCTDCHGSHTVRRVREMTQGNRYCLGCHERKLRMTFKSGEKLTIHINEQLLNQSVHNNLSCTDCHYGFSSEEHPVRKFKSRRSYSIALSESCRRCHFDKYTRTLESIHFNMLSQGNPNAPVCTDCHGSHFVTSSKHNKLASAKKCEQCHADIYNTYAKSVHGGALIEESNQDVPVCSDCHSAHDITDPRTVDFRLVIPEICGNCHADKGLMEKYDLSPAVVETYLQDFHGVTLKFYKQEGQAKPIAVCIDCHGVHDITKTTGTNTNLIKENLVKQCQKCHADATMNFPDSWVSHYEPNFTKAPLVYLINLGYSFFIPFMIIGLLLQILLHIWRYAVNR